MSGEPTQPSLEATNTVSKDLPTSDKIAEPAAAILTEIPIEKPLDFAPSSTSAADFQPAGVSSTTSEVQEKSTNRLSKAPSRKTSIASAKKVPSEENPVEEEIPQPKKKGVSRFFSILNCCGASKDANSLELDPALPSKKAKTLQPTRGRQPTPMTKPDATAESSKTESKEAIVDSIAGPPYSEHKPATKPKISEPKPISEEKPVLPNDHPPILAEKTVPEQPLPPIPPTVDEKEDVAMTNADQVYDEKADAKDAPVEEPNIPDDGGMSKEEMAINDRTPQQEARDIEMPDAPPPPQPAPKSPAPPQTNLPPPPPLNTPIRPPPTDRRISNGVEPPKWLLPPIDARFTGKKCLVLDLDETLVHSSFKILHQADFTIPVEIEGQYHNVYVIKRPGVDQFMKRVGELYEVVVFTASVSKYGDPLLDQLDIHNVVHHRLFRESCYNHQGNYVKDLSQVGRDLRETIIIDNSPTSYIFHPQHAVPISSWFSDAHDNELLDLIPVLEDLAGPQVRDVSLVLDVGL
ncbi:MAG: hypothetical protein Q9212_001495 [Teloschistes hypoglaucus]